MSMSVRLAALLCLLAAPVMAQDPVTWRLVSLNGADFNARATLSFLPDGTLQGDGPCNSYGGQLTALPPDWALGPVRSTRMACDALDAEAAFFATLSAMTAAQDTGNSLTLTGPDGTVMVFVPTEG